MEKHNFGIEAPLRWENLAAKEKSAVIVSRPYPSMTSIPREFCTYFYWFLLVGKFAFN